MEDLLQSAGHRIQLSVLTEFMVGISGERLCSAPLTGFGIGRKPGVWSNFTTSDSDLGFRV